MRVMPGFVRDALFAVERHEERAEGIECRHAGGNHADDVERTVKHADKGLVARVRLHRSQDGVFAVEAGERHDPGQG